MSSVYTIQSCQLAEGEVGGIESLSMSTKDDDVTPAVLLQHMQGMEQRLRDEFRSGLQSLEDKVDRNHEEARRNHEEARRNHAIVMTGLDNIDERLDDIEVVQVPKLKKAVGIR